MAPPALSGLGSRVSGLGYKLQGLGFRVCGLRVEGLGFRWPVWGVRFRLCWTDAADVEPDWHCSCFQDGSYCFGDLETKGFSESQTLNPKPRVCTSKPKSFLDS